MEARYATSRALGEVCLTLGKEPNAVCEEADPAPRAEAADKRCLVSIKRDAVCIVYPVAAAILVPTEPFRAALRLPAYSKVD